MQTFVGVVAVLACFVLNRITAAQDQCGQNVTGSIILHGIQGAQGPEGDRGPAGPTGETGDSGAPGATVDDVLQQINCSICQAELEELRQTITHLNQSLSTKIEEGDRNTLDTVKQSCSCKNDSVVEPPPVEPPPVEPPPIEPPPIEPPPVEPPPVEPPPVEPPPIEPPPEKVTKCDIEGNWRRVAHFDMTAGDSCPPGLATVTGGNNQKACARHAGNAYCTSVNYAANGSYTHVCGKLRGFQFRSTNFAVVSNSLESHYVEGISITHGHPRRHLWTYTSGYASNCYHTGTKYRCPCANNGLTKVPSFIGEHYYCEGSADKHINGKWTADWNDPLWDGKGCPNKNCCKNYGWFQREIAASTEPVEVRWCCSWGCNGRYLPAYLVYVDQLEMWVM